MSATAPAGGVTRRELFGIAAGTAFVVGFAVPIDGFDEAVGTSFAANAFIRIDREGNVAIIMPQVEMGQGIQTALGMVLAEELDADWTRVTIEDAPPNNALYSNPLLGEQITGGSTSMRAFWTPLRKAGAGARACLVEAAARMLSVAPETLRTEYGFVIHDASGRRMPYGALVERAATLEVPVAP